MKYVVALVTLTVVLIAGNSWAGEMVDLRGEIPQAQLAEMGLAGLQPVTDAEGELVRGEGFFGALLGLLGIAYGRSTSNSSSLFSNASASGLGLGNNIGAASTGTNADARIGLGLFPLNLFFSTSGSGFAVGLGG